MQDHRFRRTTLLTVGSLRVVVGIGLARTKYALSGEAVLLALLFALLTIALLTIALLGEI